MSPLEVAPKLSLIPLDQNLSGFTSFIGAWLYKGRKTFLVDVGPAATIAVLLKALDALEVRHLDAILLTHIHIDHAGGVGDLAAYFPNTPIVCHQKGHQHLIDPSRLWEGSLKTLGETAWAYGPFRPLPSKLLVDAARYTASEVEPILTPGHAAHHVSFLVDTYLFVGEAGGVCLDLSGIDAYLRPATPPRFFLETSIASIDNLIAKKPSRICYGHFGIKEDAVEMLKTHRKQLFFWEKIIQEEMNLTRQADDTSFLDNCLQRCLQEDSNLKAFFHMDAAVKEREKQFLLNSINGFVGYLRTIADNS
jgi:glyoxylase-like metal-dependent hydrolase (beta-lactamase superfamily II)